MTVGILSLGGRESHLCLPTRKSWLVPTQYLLGFFMVYLSGTVNVLLQSEGGPQVGALTAVFFMLAFLAATQVAALVFMKV